MRTRAVALVATTLSSFLTPFMGAAVAVALPSIGREFRMDPVLLAWIVTSFLLAVGVFLVPMGRVADMCGRKKVYLIGIGLFAVASLLCGFARSGSSLMVCRFLQGLGAAMNIAPGMAIVTSLYPASQRGKILGINIGTVYMGMSVGPFLGGLITDHLGWRYIFFLTLPVFVLVVVAVLFYLKQEWAEAKGESFDLAGSLIYGATLASLIVGFTLLSTLTGAILIVAALAGCIFFVKQEERARHPMLDLALFKGNRLFSFSTLSGIISYAATYAIVFILSLYLQSVRGMKAEGAGLVLVSQPLVQGVFTFVAGRVSDRTEPRVVASAGMAVIVAGLLLLSCVSADTGLSFIVAVLALVGFGFALFAAPNANAVMASVKPKFFGVASAALISTGTVGQLLSMGITSLVFALYLGRLQIDSVQVAPLLASLKILFVVFSLVSTVGFFISAARGKVHGRSPRLLQPE
jgi:EmrB/QacA subfamily drug resistance transporter